MDKDDLMEELPLGGTAEKESLLTWELNDDRRMKYCEDTMFSGGQH